MGYRTERGPDHSLPDVSTLTTAVFVATRPARDERTVANSRVRTATLRTVDSLLGGNGSGLPGQPWPDGV